MSLCNICKPMYPVSVGKEDPNVPIKLYLSSHYIVDPDTHEPVRPCFETTFLNLILLGTTLLNLNCFRFNFLKQLFSMLKKKDVNVSTFSLVFCFCLFYKSYPFVSCIKSVS